MSLRQPHIVDVQRKYEGEMRGYVVARNSQCIVIRQFDGFLPDGFAVLPTSTVKELTINERWTEMIAAEGHASLAGVKPPFPVDNFWMVVDYLVSNAINVRLDCEKCPDAREFGSHFGRIVERHSAHIDFAFFTSSGRWAASYPIPRASVTQIVVHSHYIDTFSKYLGPVPRQSSSSG